ncbi:MAG TPA: helix-turn-helix domain-containing protein [Polyangia bacterium]|jgi:sigma-54 specific flagellar transcriptional regulator A|nr:helix-turn-helix domain-containing protein [Polyangia bacterium]
MTSRDGAGNTAWAPLPEDAAELTPEPTTPAPVVTLPVDLPVLLRELEDAYIRAALEQTHSNKKEAAKLLGLGRTTLVEKLRRRNLAAIRSSS